MIRYYNSKSYKLRQESKTPLENYKRNKLQRRNKSIRYAEKSESHSVWQTNDGLKRTRKSSKRL